MDYIGGLSPPVDGLSKLPLIGVGFSNTEEYCETSSVCFTAEEIFPLNTIKVSNETLSAQTIALIGMGIFMIISLLYTTTHLAKGCSSPKEQKPVKPPSLRSTRKGVKRVLKKAKKYAKSVHSRELAASGKALVTTGRILLAEIDEVRKMQARHST